MAKTDRGDDPQPCERTPAGPLFVPVRPGPAGCAARMFRTPLGDRTAVGFTTRDRLTATLGPDQTWISLAEPALRALAAPLGVTTVTVDPQLSAPAVARTTRSWRVRDVSVTGAAVVADALALWIG
ncbi:SAV_915 family protein [Streptomyces violascens]|uniref:SAV_915 family protein n=1 Tax=Streptomyces violascens TaxID=67381 RepID=UPI003646470B